MTHPEIVIGLARRADAKPIALMSRELIEHGLEWSWTPQRVAASLRNPAALVAVARLGDRLSGFGIMRYGDDHARLDLLGVAAQCRRLGIARRLVQWLERPALVAGISSVALEVRASNVGAQLFYERLGYRKLTRIAGYYQGRETAIRMGRELGDPTRQAPDVWAELEAVLARAYAAGHSVSR